MSRADTQRVRFVWAAVPEDEGGFTVCWVGWLPLAALCGLVLGFIVGLAVGVLTS